MGALVTNDPRIEDPRIKDVGAYVHWPFCLAKCPYCDFNSHVRDGVDQDRWQHAYRAEIRAASGRLGSDAQISSIFFGGGTPSLMAPGLVQAILNSIAGEIGIAPDAEITLEANPTSAEAANFRAYRAAGVNRLSLGMQALDDRALKFLGREHDVAGAKAALGAGMEVFDKVSFDLIYARPGQGPAEWRQELAQALAFGTGHLSLYQLTIEPGTRFAETYAQGGLALLDDDRAADLFEITQELCEGAGLPAYEISNHARPGEESIHNLLYWRSGDWLGIGPGGHGRLTTSAGRIATAQVRSPEQWLSAVEKSGSGAEPDTHLDATARLEEQVLMGMRLREGLNETAFHRQTGRTVDEAFGVTINALAGDGFVERADGALRATAKGRMVLNQIVRQLVDSAASASALAS